MALVLNAVAGARRSQRNNARQADVNQVAAAYNQFLATRNRLPEHFGELAAIVDRGFGHYTPDRINNAGSWSATVPASTTPAHCSATFTVGGVSSATSQSVCEDGPDGIAGNADDETWIAAGVTGRFDWDIAYASIPATTVKLSDSSTPDSADYMLVINQAECNAGNILPISGGIREAVIVYRLEGQDNTLCLEI